MIPSGVSVGKLSTGNPHQCSETKLMGSIAPLGARARRNSRPIGEPKWISEKKLLKRFKPAIRAPTPGKNATQENHEVLFHRRKGLGKFVAGKIDASIMKLKRS
jgi:hypothetical protein